MGKREQESVDGGGGGGGGAGTGNVKRIDKHKYIISRESLEDETTEGSKVMLKYILTGQELRTMRRMGPEARATRQKRHDVAEDDECDADVDETRWAGSRERRQPDECWCQIHGCFRKGRHKVCADFQDLPDAKCARISIIEVCADFRDYRAFDARQGERTHKFI